MKRFLLTCLLGFVVFIGLLLIVECLIIPKLPNEFSYKYDYVDSHRNEISTLLMGNSYFENSLNPRLINDSTFDLAVFSRWIGYDAQLLDIFVPIMPNMQTVIFPMGYKIPFMDYHSYPKKIVDFYHEKYMHVFYNRFPHNVDRWLAIRYSDRIGFKSWIVTVDPVCRGEFLVYGHENDNWRNEQNILPDVISQEGVDEALAEYTYYLKSMAKVCADNKVRFIVVTPPCHDSFNQNVRQEGINTLYHLIEDAQAITPFEYKDYLFDEEFRADSLYFNCSHLNKIGADKFALRLKEDFDL